MVVVLRKLPIALKSWGSVRGNTGGSGHPLTELQKYRERGVANFTSDTPVWLKELQYTGRTCCSYAAAQQRVESEQFLLEHLNSQRCHACVHIWSLMIW